MKKDSLYGPPKEIYDEGNYQKKQRHLKKKAKEAESEDSDDLIEEYMNDQGEDTAAYNQMALRRYEIQKLKYFYAIVHCNNSKTALHLYDEYNGLLIENTNIRLRMAIVPNETEFEQNVKDKATMVPQNHNYDHFQNKLNRALGHTDVKLTWDQTDVKRQEKLVKGFQAAAKDDVDSEAEKAYYKEFLASASEDDNENLEEMRGKLLAGLNDDDEENQEQDEVDWDNLNSDELDSEDLDNLEKGKGLKKEKNMVSKDYVEDVGQKLLDSKKQLAKESAMTLYEKYQAQKREKKAAKKAAHKAKKEAQKKMSKMTE